MANLLVYSQPGGPDVLQEGLVVAEAIYLRELGLGAWLLELAA